MKLVIAILTAVTLSAQTANLSGLVNDSSHALVPDATVRVVNESTGVSRVLATSKEGSFAIAFLPPGSYRITVEAEGFKASVRTGVVLNAGDAREDFTLEPGSLEQSVTVNASSSLTRSETIGVGTVIEQDLVQALPLNGRSFQSLIALTPGVVMTKATFGDQGQFSVNGQRANANYFSIDGASANIGVSAGLTLVQSSSGSLPGLGAAGGTNTLVAVESIEQFQVQTSAYAAEYGRMPGAQITILTRAGSNQLHGAIFEYFRNEALDATDWFANANRLPKPELRQNDFGGVLGGPILRNRTFFFFSYEGLRLRQPQVLSTDVPSLDARSNGCKLCRPFLNSFPLPDRPGGRNGFSTFVASYSDISALDAFSLRLDHSIKSRATVFARFNYAPSSYTTRSLTMLSNPTDTTAGTQTLTAGATAILTPSIVNIVTVNSSLTTAASRSRLDTFGGAVPFDPHLLYTVPTVDIGNAFTAYTLAGGVNSSFYYGKNVSNAQRQWNAADSVSLSSGRHQMKFGVDWRHVATLNDPRAYDLAVVFSSVQGAALGQTALTTISAQERIVVYLRNLSIYAQDSWRLGSRLTLSYGMRWEVNPAPTGSLPLYTLTGYQQPSTIQLASKGTPLYRTRYGNFAPRSGIAYRINESTTLRAGYGIFYDLGAGLIGQSSAGFPYFRQNTNSGKGTPFPVPLANAMPPPFTLSPPVTSIYGAQAGLRLPLTHEWDVTLERLFGPGRIASLAYVGAAGRHLLRQTYYLNPNQNVVYAYLLTNGSFSDFNSLQAQYQQRLSHGLLALVSYTLGKSLDNTSTESALNLNAAQLNPKDDRGPSDFDIRQTLTTAFSYTLPVQQHWRRLRPVTSGWGLDGVIIARSATPVNVLYSRDEGFGVTSLRPDLVYGAPLYTGDPNVPGGREFNFNAFAIPGSYPGRQGTLGRNVLRGFPLSQLNLTLRRELRLLEGWKLQFRAEMFNATNHPAFGDPTGSLFSPQFGVATQSLSRGLGQGGVNGGLNPLYQIGGPRSIQLALRLAF